MDARTIVALRLHSQQLTGQTAQKPVEVVARLGAVQAQDYAGALWSVAQRMVESADATEVAVERALATGSIVRSWPLRRTYHLVAAADLRWMLALLGPRALGAAARNRALLGVEETELDQAREVVLAALAGGAPRTRDDLLSTMQGAGIKTEGQRGIHMLVNMAQSAQICMGPRVGKEYTFVALDEWVPASAPLEREEALGRLARRYFAGHGPATLKDFIWWAYITMADARLGVEVADSALARVNVGKTEYWMAANAQDGAAEIPPALLLPGFDELMLGYADRSAALDPAHSKLLQPGGNGMFKPFFMVEGRVAGIWQRKLRARSVDVTIEPFAPLDARARRAVAEQVERYGRFLGRLPA